MHSITHICNIDFNFKYHGSYSIFHHWTVELVSWRVVVWQCLLESRSLSSLALQRRRSWFVIVMSFLCKVQSKKPQRKTGEERKQGSWVQALVSVLALRSPSTRVNVGFRHRNRGWENDRRVPRTREPPTCARVSCLIFPQSERS